MNSPINRREALSLLGAGACAALTGTVPSVPSPEATQARSVATPLKTVNACPERLIGIAATKATLQDASSAQIITREFNLLTPSGLKWDAVHPQPDKYDFTEADWNVNFAQQNGLQIHGHNLCWNSPAAYPPWFKTGLNKSNAEQFLTSHITTVVKRYSGRISSWDVVNEPVTPWSKRGDGLYPGVWTDLLGPTYIDIAFHATAAADPRPLRILNTYRLEQGTEDDEKGRTDTLELLNNLLARGVPVQAVGIESHLDTSQPLGGTSFQKFLSNIRALNLQVVITELDVKEDRAVGDSAAWGQKTAQYYGEYLNEVIPIANPLFIIFWSLKDRWESGKRIQGLMQDNLSPRLTYKGASKVLGGRATCG
jgi:endo-1,4-beta-xylanase